MTDEQLLERLRADLDEYVGEPGPAPMITPPPVRRRPLWIPLAAAAAVIALVAGGLVVLTQSRDADEPTPLGVEDGTMPVPPTPAGWAVVEWGSLRLSVPPEMDPFADPSGCTNRRPNAVLDCSGLGFSIQYAPDPGIVGNEGTVVNGLDQVRIGEADGVFVRDLAMDVFFEGLTPETAWAIADTIGVSSRWRVEQGEPTPPVPPEWRTVTYQGVSVRVPADWTVGNWTDPDPRFCLRAGDVVRPGVLLGRGPVGDAADDCDGPVSLMPPTSGVRIYEIDQPVDLPTTLPIGERVVTGDGGAQILVRVGLGIDAAIDSRVARVILDSITGARAPTTAPPATEPAVDEPTAASGLPAPPTPDGWSVVEWGDVRFSLPPDLDAYGPGCDARDEQGILVLTCGERVVAVIPAVGAGQLDPPGTIDLNGLAARRTENRCPEGCSPDFRESTEFVLLDVSTVVRFTGFVPDEVDELAATIGVSSRWRVKNESPPPPQPGWSEIYYLDLTLSIPPDWEVQPASCDPAPALAWGPAGQPVVAVCRNAQPELTRPADGVAVYRIDGDNHPDVAPGLPIAERTIELGDGNRYAVLVGLGGDGTIGRTILGSLSIADFGTPATTAPPPDTTVYETVATVIEAGGQAQLCLYGVDESYPPGCQGVELVGFDWDGITPEGSQDGTTWGPVYVRGSYDESAQSFTVAEARAPTDADTERLSAGVGAPDFSTPCPEPADGWPPVTDLTAFPSALVSSRNEFAGMWFDQSNSVYTVKVVGEVASTEMLIGTQYDGPICVVPAVRTLTELRAVQQQLRTLSSVRVLDTFISVDATGERVFASVLTSQPQLQAAFDDDLGPGTVVFLPLLTVVA